MLADCATEDASRNKMAGSKKQNLKELDRRLNQTAMRKFWEFTLTGTGVGLVFGLLLYPVSGNVFVIIFLTALVTVIGAVLGIVHRHDP